MFPSALASCLVLQHHITLHKILRNIVLKHVENFM